MQDQNRTLKTLRRRAYMEGLKTNNYEVLRRLYKVLNQQEMSRLEELWRRKVTQAHRAAA